jgi:hypothetical protein
MAANVFETSLSSVSIIIQAGEEGKRGELKYPFQSAVIPVQTGIQIFQSPRLPISPGATPVTTP